MKPIFRFSIRLFAVVFFLIGCKGESENLKKINSAQGVHYFIYGDFGSLNLDGFNRMTQPWRISNAARALRKGHEPKNIHTYTRKQLERFGFIYPDRILNLPADAEAVLQVESPMGIIDGFIENKTLRVSAASIGCATCHAGRVYDSNGFATNNVWLGLPNTSINLEAYTRDVYKNLAYASEGAGRWVQFKDFYRNAYQRPVKELNSLSLMGSRFRKQINEVRERSGRLAPYTIGVPGMTNGIGALKTQLGVLNQFQFDPNEIGFVSIPVLADRQFRSSLLVDGVYSVKNSVPFFSIDWRSSDNADHLDGLAKIVAVFLIPTMGNLPSQVEPALDDVRKAFGFVRNVRMPAFPATIDFEKVTEGEKIYVNQCSSCHGSYSGAVGAQRLVQFPNRLSPLSEIGTDPARALLAEGASLQRLIMSQAGKLIDAKSQGGYVAPILTGLWTSAPYLHNGSVPSLWDLLTPADRPEKFYVGGHALDYTKMGLSYPSGYVPFSTPYLYDTTRPGHSNRGHQVYGTDLSDEQKWQLIEYLKTI